MKAQLVTPPAEEPLNLAAAKLHLREENDNQDTLIASLITAARELAELMTRRALVTQTWRVKRDAFPCDRSRGAIELPYPPLQSVSSVKYIDPAGTEQTLPPEKYVTETDALPGRIRPAYDEQWPETRCQPDAVTIDLVAGYGAAAAVPRSVVAAMQLLIGDLYENKEALIVGTIVAANPTVRSLLSGHRVPEIA